MSYTASRPPELLLVVAAALTDGRGRVLVQRRLPGGAHAGAWEFPGGKVEPGEPPASALARELTEELGIALDPGTAEPFCFAEDPAADRHLLLLLYRCRRWTGEPRPVAASELRWVELAELAGLDMPPADLPLAALLARS